MTRGGGEGGAAAAAAAGVGAGLCREIQAAGTLLPRLQHCRGGASAGNARTSAGTLAERALVLRPPSRLRVLIGTGPCSAHGSAGTAQVLKPCATSPFPPLAARWGACTRRDQLPKLQRRSLQSPLLPIPRSLPILAPGPIMQVAAWCWAASSGACNTLMRPNKPIGGLVCDARHLRVPSPSLPPQPLPYLACP